MKAVLMSIKPKWCELIASGKKTVEIRKTKPKLEVPFKVYIYETKDKRYENIGVCGRKKDGTIYIFKNHCGKVIGEFVCYRISGGSGEYAVYHTEGTCLTSTEIADYIGDKYAYYWHISNLVIYDEPRELWEFYALKKCHSCDSGYESTACIYDEECKVPIVIKRPPQSWCYVEELKHDES